MTKGQMLASCMLVATSLTAGVAEAQDWTHLACDYTWVIHDNGERREAAESHIYRFNDAQIDRWVADSASWYPECDAARGGFTEASCSISDSAILAVRRSMQGGETVRLDSIRINRMTAAYTAHFEFSSGTSGDADSNCRPADDPYAGLQQRF